LSYQTSGGNSFTGGSSTGGKDICIKHQIGY
jgi:hypothetical protein